MVTDSVSEKQKPLFSHKLGLRANDIHSWLCIGLDPEVERLPDRFPRSPRGVVDFCRHIVEATRDVAAAFKPNTAFFESLGPEGWRALAEVREYIGDDPVIIDAKRGDMGNTARAYARAFFDYLAADALTVNPYLGPDSLEPFMGFEGRCVFVLTRTSNPGSGVVQDAESESSPLYLHVARWASSLAAATEVGFVVGATNGDAIRALRSEHPAALLLLPGVGAQGAEAGKAMRLGADQQGRSALPSVSRAVLYASRGTDFAEKARRVAEVMAAETWLPVTDDARR